jgi:hypothetical protein
MFYNALVRKNKADDVEEADMDSGGDGAQRDE